MLKNSAIMAQYRLRMALFYINQRVAQREFWRARILGG